LGVKRHSRYNFACSSIDGKDVVSNSLPPQLTFHRVLGGPFIDWYFERESTFVTPGRTKKYIPCLHSWHVNTLKMFARLIVCIPKLSQKLLLQLQKGSGKYVPGILTFAFTVIKFIIIKNNAILSEIA
jgi:hypothetical protein